MGRVARKRVDKTWDLGLMGVADDPCHTWENGELFGGALGIAAGDDETGGGVLCVNFADGVAGLGVSGGGYGACVEDDDGGRGGIGGLGAAAIEELAFEGGAIGLGGAAAELLDVEGGHLSRVRSDSLSKQNELLGLFNLRE